MANEFVARKGIISNGAVTVNSTLAVSGNTTVSGYINIGAGSYGTLYFGGTTYGSIISYAGNLIIQNPNFIYPTIYIGGGPGNTVNSLSIPLGSLTVGKNINFSAPASGITSGEIVYYGTGTTTAGYLYYLNTSLVWTLADADAAASASGMLGIAIGTNPASNGMLVRGSARFDALTPYTTMTAGQILYVSTTAGDFTATAPTGTGKVVRVIGYCVDDTNNTLYFCPDNTWIELT